MGQKRDKNRHISQNPRGSSDTRRANRFLWLVMAVVLIIASIVIGRWLQARQAIAAAKAAAAKQEASLQQSLGIDALPPGRAAPSFTLTDESGKSISLASLKGKVVVLQFMDPKCTDICPIVSQELVLADKYLGAKASHVAFVAVNVNQYHEKTSELQAFSKQHGLSDLANWYFLTGSTESLKKVWQDYGIFVQPNPTGDVVHSSYYYFIDKSGTERYLAPATNDTKTITEWGKGIAVFSAKLM